jgi:hypothetical protein
MLTSVQVENPEPLLGSNRPMCRHFSPSNSPLPLWRSRSGLIQELLHHQFATNPRSVTASGERALEHRALALDR